MITKHLISALLYFLGLIAFAQNTFSGRVIDASTNSPLAYATIGFTSSSIGTVSNDVGQFKLVYPESLINDTLRISYIGYKTLLIVPNNHTQSNLRLTPVTLELSEVVVRPLAPEDYIKKAVRNFPNAFPRDPFGSQSYYQEMIKENNQYISFSECVFKSFYPAYQDTTKSQHQLLLYRKNKNHHQIQFMRDKIEKEKLKEEKKATKKGEEYIDEEKMLIENTFGGPANILSMDLLKYPEPFLDSTQFKKFRYSFGNPEVYQEKQLLTIQFEAKKTVDHMVQKGIIYLDVKSNAIVMVDYTAEIVIPMIVRPLLFAYGLSADNVMMTKKVRYQPHNNRWYPDYFFLYVYADLEKRHLFSANEKSNFKLSQQLKINEIDLNNLSEIPADYRYNLLKKIEEQVHNVSEMKWEYVNVLLK